MLNPMGILTWTLVHAIFGVGCLFEELLGLGSNLPLVVGANLGQSTGKPGIGDEGATGPVRIYHLLK